MGKVLAPFDFMTIGLGWSALSLTLIKRGAAYPFDFFQAGRTPCPDYLDAHLVPVVNFLPNIRESKRIVVL